MRISENGLDLIKNFEGCKLEAYKCPAGVWTIGYGSTGPHVKPGMRITQQRADELLEEDVKRFEDGINRMVNFPLQQHEFDALCSFAFNLGLAALEHSTLFMKLNHDDREGAAQEFLRWNRAGGQVLPGLTRRRIAERFMFLGLSWR